MLKQKKFLPQRTDLLNLPPPSIPLTMRPAKLPSHRPELRIKRIHEPVTASDGYRVLVDRLWPRGISRERAALDLWLKEIAPSPALRQWFAHDPAKFAEFRLHYLQELALCEAPVALLLAQLQHGPVTLLYAARDPLCNHARVLLECLDARRA